MVEQDETGSGELQPGSAGILEAVIEATLDSIFVKDLDGRYLLVNSTCARFIGRPKEQILGRRDPELYPPETARRFVEADRRVIETGETQVFEGLATGAGGTQAFRVTKGVVRDREGRVVGLFGISHDMTERMRAEEERVKLAREQAARAAAEEASRAKDVFLATLSHELRTPLTAILGWAVMIDGDAVDEATARDGIKAIRRSAEQQRHIVDDILDASRIITGKLRIEPRPVELARAAQAAVDVVRPAAEAKGIQLDCDFEAGRVMGDPNRLQQVFWNLLSNAVKFTPAGGGIKVEVARLLTHARLTVSDTGQGIAPEFLPYVFDRFRQADSSTSRAHGGLGLGLSLVKHLVELHGGSVHAHSEGEGQGACFTVDLPLAHAAGPDSSVARSGQAPAAVAGATGRVDAGKRPPTLAGSRVLLVDDHEDTLHLLSTLLKMHGAEVTAVTSVADALLSLVEVRPDVLVSDIGLPGEDGYELIQRVRALEAGRGGRTPSVALTAYAGEGDRLHALSAGFDAHVAKPVGPKALVATIASLLEDVKTPEAG
jgi:PAS domain S-box-containing protein